MHYDLYSENHIESHCSDTHSGRWKAVGNTNLPRTQELSVVCFQAKMRELRASTIAQCPGGSAAVAAGTEGHNYFNFVGKRDEKLRNNNNHTSHSLLLKGCGAVAKKVLMLVAGVASLSLPRALLVTYSNDHGGTGKGMRYFKWFRSGKKSDEYLPKNSMRFIFSNLLKFHKIKKQLAEFIGKQKKQNSTVPLLLLLEITCCISFRINKKEKNLYRIPLNPTDHAESPSRTTKDFVFPTRKKSSSRGRTASTAFALKDENMPNKRILYILVPARISVYSQLSYSSDANHLGRVHSAVPPHAAVHFLHKGLSREISSFKAGGKICFFSEFRRNLFSLFFLREALEYTQQIPEAIGIFGIFTSSSMNPSNDRVIQGDAHLLAGLCGRVYVQRFFRSMGFSRKPSGGLFGLA